MTEVLKGIGWALRLWTELFGPLGLIALLLAVLIAVAVVSWAVRSVSSMVGALFGIRDFKLRNMRVTHPSAWRWLKVASALVGLVIATPRAIADPTGPMTLVAVVSAGWIVVRAVEFVSDYPLTFEGLIAAGQTAVTRQALDLVWQVNGIVVAQGDKLRLPRYDSWTVARMNDGFRYGLHCNGFVCPQGSGGLGRIMEMCASPGSEYDTITSNLNAFLLDPAELRGPLVTLLRYLGKMPEYAGTLIDRPDGYPAGVGRLTLLERIPLERVRRYPWRPGYWIDQINDRVAQGVTREQAVAQLVERGAPVGFDSEGRPVLYACSDLHSQVFGITRTGKSTLLEAFLHFVVEMPTDLVRLYIVDLKGGAHLNGYRARCSGYASTPDEADRLLTHVAEQLMRPRFEMLRASGRQKITEPSTEHPFVFVVIDEGSQLNPEALEVCGDIAQLGAGGRVMLTFSAQYMRQEDGMPRRLSLNLDNRMSTRLPDGTASLVAMGRGGTAPNCAPHLIRKGIRTRGVFCYSRGGADPDYARSFLTGGIADQHRRARLALRVWGRPHAAVLEPPRPQPAPEPEPAAVEPEPEPADWTDERRAAMRTRLGELARACGDPDAQLDPDAITAHRLNTLLNVARRRHNPRTAEPAERQQIQRRRNRVERLGRELHDDLAARNEHATALRAEQAEPAVVS